MYIYHLRLNTIIVFFCISILFTNVFFTGSSLDNSDVYLSSSSNSRGSPRSPYIIDLNTTTAYPHQNITIYGLDSEDNAGYSVASGDVNNDGRDDIIIGAYHANGPGDTKIDCGKVYVLFSDNTLNGTISASQADMIIYGAESGDSIGDSITTGDVNGDTIDDIVIGATLADGLGNGRANSGEVYVIFGSNSLPAVKNLAISPPDVLIYGAESGDFSGKSVVTGDINGDNIHDIIIGAIYADGPSETRSNCGEVYLIYGNTVLPSNIDLASQADVTIYGVDAGDLAGHSVSAGDVNNNGYGDIIIGAIWARGPGNMRMFGGEAYLVYGNGSMLSTIDLATQANMTIYGKSQPSFGGCLGSSVASGDVNGDNIDDIIIGAQSEGILVSYMIAGAVHIIYGSTSLPIIQDLQMLKSNVTINGSCFYGYSGWAVAAGDINGDLIDDIIISSYRADKPLNGRSQCGEVHVINGSSSLPSQIDLIESEEDILVYGAESDDQVGISLAVGTIDSDNKYDIIIGAPYADGVNNIVTNCGEVYLILSAGEVFPTLKTEFIGLINGDGINNTTCYAKYKPYTFRVKVKVSRGLSALKTVNLGLDYHNNNLQYKWSEYGRNFTEVSDPNDYAFLNSMSTFRNNSKDTWTIDFNITFNWSYPDNDFHSIEVHSTSDSGLYDWLNLTDDIYRVENHLDFNGTLIAIGNYQGTLTEEDWVRGGEQINWSGLKVVYDGTNATYPPKGSGVNVTVWDSDGDYWNENPNSGENISITSPAAIKTNLNEIFILNITGVPSTCDNSSVTFKLNIDADNVSFANSFPNKQQWNTMLNPQCGITILDPTTKVNASSIQYQISTDNGTTWESDWINFETQQEDAESINCIVRPIFKDGKDNLIKWRAKDILGNGYTESEKFRILIDISNVTYSNITPSSEEWQTNLSVVCNITIIDNLSGVDASSIEFRISTDGIYNYGIWQSARKAINRNIIHCSVSPKFKEGIENYIQWRAKDIVGNGPFVSEDYQIKIKINYPPEVILLSPSDSIIIKTLTPELVWKGTDPDEDTSIYYYVYLNTDENKIINLDKSALLVSNFIDPKYKLESPLEDGFTYYWTVIPNDGIINGICSSGIWHFKIDTTVEIPIVTLVSPINNSNVSTQTPSLTWNVNYSNKKIVSYNVFIDLFSSLDNFTADHELPSFMPSQPLIRGASYYWTVIPIADTPAGKIQGICESGIWKFTVGYSITNIYELDIELESNNLIVKQGEYISTNVTVTNIGNTVDIIDLDLDEGIIDANIALERLGTPIRLNESESITLKLEIKTFEEIEVKNYTITVTAISNGALAEKQDITASETLRLQIIEKDAEQTQPTDKESDWALWAALIIIAIIIVLALTFFIYRKRQAEKVPVLKAELEYKPPELVELPGITTPAAGAAAKPELPSAAAQAQPQVASGVTPTPALAPTPGQAVPQLPQATLSKAQQLNLLRERFLRGEVTEETYNKLRAEIETSGEEAETVEDISMEGEGKGEGDVAPKPSAAEPEMPPPEQPTATETPAAQIPAPETPQPGIAPIEEPLPAPESESQVQQPIEPPQAAQPKLGPKIKPPSVNEEE